MTPNQTDNVIVGYRKATDAQQRIIQELRSEIARLQAGGCSRNQSTTQFCAEAVEVGEKLGAMQRHVALCRQIVKCPDDETLAEWLKGFVRLDDPVVTGLVEAVRESCENNGGPIDMEDTTEGLFDYVMVRLKDFEKSEQALSAYEARVKEVSGE